MSEQLPGWYRGLQVILGFVAVIISIAVWIYYSFAFALMIILFALGLMVMGLSGVIIGAAGKGIPGWRRGLSLILGVLIIVLSFMVIIYPAAGVSFLIILLALGLLMAGIIGIASGATNSQLKGWQRALLIIFGIVIVLLSIGVLFQPTLGTILWMPIFPPLFFILPGNFIPPYGLVSVIPSTGYMLLVLFLSIGLLLRGIQAIVSGIKGTE